MKLRQVQARIETPPGLDAQTHQAVRSATRDALRGQTIQPGATLEVPVQVPLEAELDCDEEGRVTEDTVVEVRTTTSTAAEKDDDPLFSTRLAPDPELEKLYDSLLGLDEKKIDLVKMACAMVEHRERIGGVRHLVGLSGKVLFAGPPGTAKTSLAKGFGDTLARELDATVAIHEVQTSTLLSKYVGESAQNVAGLFDDLRATAEAYPFSLVVLDEYDALAGDRRSEQDHQDAKRAVNQLLMELDRTSFWDDNLFIVAVSNLAEETDPAVLRRFDKIYDFPLPGPVERQAILEHKLHHAATDLPVNVPLEAGILRRAAEHTEGYSGADLARVVGRSIMRALNHDGVVNEETLAQGLDEVRPAQEIIGGAG